MKQYRLTLAATDDIDDAVAFIASDDPKAALRLRDRLFSAFNLLCERPHVGRIRPELSGGRTDLLFWPVSSYLVIYRDRNFVEIVRVLSGYRDIAAILPQSTD